MIAAALEAAVDRLAGISSSARLDAELLLAHALGTDRVWLRAQGERAIDAAVQARFAALVERRADGVPVAYLLGRRDFWTLTLEVSPAVLVPRPETELLVELALARLAGRREPTVLDLGTGSGAIGLAIASERPDAQVDLVDVNAEALAVAEANRSRLRLGNTRTLLGDWFGPVARRRYDLVVANPPYLATDDPHLAAPELGQEPRQALVSGATGLEALGAIAAQAGSHLRAGGVLVLEHGALQGPATRRLLADAGFVAIRTHPDLAGLDRATEGAPGS